MTHKRPLRMIKRQSGVGMIEVMVSVLIFVSGVFGVMNMQNQALRANHDSLQRSQAFWLGNSAIERIKLNYEGLDVAGGYQSEAQKAISNLNSYCLSPPKQCTGSNANCSAAEMARFDMYELMCRKAPLINLRMFIDCPTGSCGSKGALIEVKVEWSSRRATKGATPEQRKLFFSTRRN